MATDYSVIFIDTNIFLHFRAIDEINWPELLGTDSVQIVIPPITLRELNTHKEIHRDARIRKRAGRAIQFLQRVLAREDVGYVRSGVTVRIEPQDPPHALFEENRLQPYIQDDHLLASIIDYSAIVDSQDVTLVTADAGLLLLAKARDRQIKTLELPVAYRIPSTEDPQERRIRELTKQLERATARMPVLAIEFNDHQLHMRARLSKPLELDSQQVATTLFSLKQEHPPMDGHTIRGSTNQSISEILQSFGAAYQFNQPTAEQVSRYNEQLTKFYVEYESYLVSKNKYENLQCHLVRIDLCLVNTGTCPASDIDVFLHFPDGFDLLNETQLPCQPQAPNPPSKPRSPHEEAIARLNWTPPYHSFLSEFQRDYDDLTSNVSDPDIRRTNSYDVTIHVQRIKHSLYEELQPMFVLFGSYEDAKSFSIEYEILAENTPHAVSGKLHVAIDKDQID